MKQLDVLLQEHPFFADLPAEYIDLIAGCGRNIHFNVNESIFREGGPANEFYIIRHGQVAIELHTPNRGDLNIYTLHENDVLGWSWLFPPYRWHFSARAIETTRAIALDGKCLRGKCDEDHSLGYELMQRFARIIVERLQATRLQVMDIYD